MNNLVFVFGTLKEGFPNFSRNSGVRVPGMYATKSAFPFFLVGARFSPWMLDSPDLGYRVRGQLFEIDSAGLREMDLLERVGEPDGYLRREISICRVGEVANLDVKAFVYLKSSQLLDSKEVRLGPLEEYTVEHSVLYKNRGAVSEG